MTRMRWAAVGAVVVIGLAVAGWLAWRHYRSTKLRAVYAEFQLKSQLNVINAVEARLAATERAMGSLAGLDSAAKVLGGRVIAGAVLELPARDTVIVHDTVATTLNPDSSRIATTEDSTFAGRVKVTALAPPWPRPLRIALEVHRPAFAPTVGFIELQDSIAFVVNWQGEHVRIAQPYHRPKPTTAARRAFLSLFADGRYLSDESFRASTGVAVAPNQWSVYGGLEQPFRIEQVGDPVWFVGVRRSFRIF